MKKVKEIMVKNVVAFKPSDPIHYAAWLLRYKKISGAPVVENKKVVGIVSERDIMQLLEEKDIRINLFMPSPFDVLELPVRTKYRLDEISKLVKNTARMPVARVMTKKVVTVSPDAAVSKAAQIMGDLGINRLPVVDKKGILVGIVTRGDVIGTLV